MELKKEIEGTLAVTYSLGLARTKALSKLASKLMKPGGVVMLLTKADEINALKRTNVEDIWGIGRQTYPKLKALGIQAAYDFVNYPDSKIAREFSRPAMDMKRELAGEEILEVVSDADPRDQKSIQSTATFRPASTDPKIIWREIAENAEHACENARDIKLVSNKISFFVKTSGFKYRFAEVKLEEYTADPGRILNALEPEFAKLLKKGERIRSTGVILHNLRKGETIPLDLFGRQEKALKRTAIEEAADRIRQKHGPGAIKHASALG